MLAEEQSTNPKKRKIMSDLLGAVRSAKSLLDKSFEINWIRSLNFCVSGLRPHSHRLWVREACDFYNANLKDVPIRISRRKSVLWDFACRGDSFWSPGTSCR